MANDTMRVWCISDVHGHDFSHFFPDPSEDIDVAILAGDLAYHSNQKVGLDVLDQFAAVPARHRILIAGNHDFFLQHASIDQDLVGILSGMGITYLQDSSVTIDGVKFYGAPWTPWYGDMAFVFPAGPSGKIMARATWSRVPTDTEVLVTHGPRYGVLDKTYDPHARGKKRHVGCTSLTKRVDSALRGSLRLHVCGHVHEMHGTHRDGSSGILTVNPSLLNSRRAPLLEPFRVYREVDTSDTLASNPDPVWRVLPPKQQFPPR